MSKKAKHPRAWGAREDGDVCDWAESERKYIERRGWDEADIVLVRIVPESDYRKIMKAMRELERENEDLHCEVVSASIKGGRKSAE